MLTAHLWKEWREQRALVLAIVGALALLAIGFGLLAPATLIRTDAEVWFVITGLAAGFAALAGDLVPGEQRRGQLGYLLRNPGALRAAFVAKLLCLMLGLSVLLLCGWALGELCIALAGGRGLLERVGSGGHAGIAFGWIVAAVTVTAPWAFAVSCWLPRGATVLPATALTLSAVIVPPVLVGASYSVPVDATEVAVAAILLLGGGLCTAWLSFVRGLRFGRRFATAARGLAAAALFALPGWIWSAERAIAWHHVDPTDSAFRIGTALLGADGHTAFLGLQDRGWFRRYAVAVNLETGAWRQLGGARSWVASVEILERCDNTELAPQPWIVRRQLHGADLLDGRTGESVVPCPDLRVPDAFRDQLAEAARHTPPFRLPNGDRVWFDRRTVVVESADGRCDTLPWPEGARPGAAVGFGIEWLRDDGTRTGEVLDLTRRRTVRVPEDVSRSMYKFVRRGSWVVKHGHPSARTERFDPDTGEQCSLGLGDGARVDALAGDGRLVVVDDTGGVFLLDPDTGAREQLQVPRDAMPVWVRPADWRRFQTPTRTPSGADVFGLMFRDAGRDRSTTFARRDGTRLVPCAITAAGVALFAIPDDDHVLVIRDGRTLERWRFGSDEVEVLFRVGAQDDRSR